MYGVEKGSRLRAHTKGPCNHPQMTRTQSPLGRSLFLPLLLPVQTAALKMTRFFLPSLLCSLLTFSKSCSLLLLRTLYLLRKTTKKRQDTGPGKPMKRSRAVSSAIGEKTESRSLSQGLLLGFTYCGLFVLRGNIPTMTPRSRLM